MDSPEVPSNWDLIESCKQRNSPAWTELLARHESRVRKSIRAQLCQKARDHHLVEDLTQNVFTALIQNDYKRLGLYDPQRGCFNTFLNAVVSHILRDWRRLKNNQTAQEGLAAGKEPIENSGEAGLLQAELAEFYQSLPPQEKRCLEGMMGEAPEQGEKAPLSAANARQLKHRLTKRARKYFEGQ
ncbi:MAG TPA: sigma-70 family RNA polymerase sigma factor [Gemmataceae bacterium]|nr:sigma-70 family RNA polymerase sigma factor [Gemmataceae bacterium]